MYSWLESRVPGYKRGDTLSFDQVVFLTKYFCDLGGNSSDSEFFIYELESGKFITGLKGKSGDLCAWVNWSQAVGVNLEKRLVASYEKSSGLWRRNDYITPPIIKTYNKLQEGKKVEPTKIR
jgi:hypothetical protein